MSCLLYWHQTKIFLLLSPLMHMFCWFEQYFAWYQSDKYLHKFFWGTRIIHPLHFNAFLRKKTILQKRYVLTQRVTNIFCTSWYGFLQNLSFLQSLYCTSLFHLLLFNWLTLLMSRAMLTFKPDYGYSRRGFGYLITYCNR